MTLYIGLVSKVLPAENLVDEAVKTGNVIASMSQPSVRMAKELINKCKCGYLVNRAHTLPNFKIMCSI
jgi:enoyl-CoA hydratase/carnithine racemase